MAVVAAMKVHEVGQEIGVVVDGVCGLGIVHILRKVETRVVQYEVGINVVEVGDKFIEISNHFCERSVFLSFRKVLLRERKKQLQ